MDNNEEIEQRGDHLGREYISLDLNKCFAFLWDVLFKPFLSAELITLIPVQVLSGFRTGGQTMNWTEMSLELYQIGSACQAC